MRPTVWMTILLCLPLLGCGPQGTTEGDDGSPVLEIEGPPLPGVDTDGTTGTSDGQGGNEEGGQTGNADQDADTEKQDGGEQDLPLDGPKVDPSPN